MITLEDVRTRMLETGHPVSFEGSSTSRAYPQIIICESGHKYVRADNRNLIVQNRYTVELYTLGKQQTEESKVESIIDSMGVPWTKGADETYSGSGVCCIEYTFWGL